MPRPIIGLTCDLDPATGKYTIGTGYAQMIARAGGVPITLACESVCLDRYLVICDGFVLTGGDDPRTEVWGVPTHPKATPVHHDRQAFEMALLARLDERPNTPLFGVCLGMQMMVLSAGGLLDQHLPDDWPTAGEHWGRVEHEIAGELGAGGVLSHHRQAATDPGGLEVVARAHDGLIEAVRDPERPFYLGVQWHPERTTDEQFGLGLFEQLIEAARMRQPVTA